MELTLHRRWKTEKSTIGELSIDGDRFCYTLEDEVRPPGVKIPGETAIPEGRYRVVFDWSPKNKRLMPHILDVPMFTRILIHAGNTDVDTEGCVLVGFRSDTNLIAESKKAFDALYPILYATWQRNEEIWITVFCDPEMLAVGLNLAQ